MVGYRSRRTEISEDDVAIGRNEYILRLEVAVNDPGTVQPLDPFRHFRHVETSSVSPESTPTSELSRQVSPAVEVERQVQGYSPRWSVG